MSSIGLTARSRSKPPTPTITAVMSATIIPTAYDMSQPRWCAGVSSFCPGDVARTLVAPESPARLERRGWPHLKVGLTC